MKTAAEQNSSTPQKNAINRRLEREVMRVNPQQPKSSLNTLQSVYETIFSDVVTPSYVRGYN